MLQFGENFVLDFFVERGDLDTVAHALAVMGGATFALDDFGKFVVLFCCCFSSLLKEALVDLKWPTTCHFLIDFTSYLTS